MKKFVRLTVCSFVSKISLVFIEDITGSLVNTCGILDTYKQALFFRVLLRPVRQLLEGSF